MSWRDPRRACIACTPPSRRTSLALLLRNLHCLSEELISASIVICVAALDTFVFKFFDPGSVSLVWLGGLQSGAQVFKHLLAWNILGSSRYDDGNNSKKCCSHKQFHRNLLSD